MRQWLINPELLCNQHLLGEHCEHHMFIGSIKKGISIEGYVKNNLLEPLSLIRRHDELVKEMERRKMKHNTPIIDTGDCISKLPNHLLQAKICVEKAYLDLLSRCYNCRQIWLRKNNFLR